MDGFYLAAMNKLKKVAEEVIKEKYNFKNGLVMIGWAIKIDGIINHIQDIKLKEKLEKECEEIWNKWYEKVQKEQLTKDNLAIMDALIGVLSKQQEVKYDNKGTTGKRDGTRGN